MKSIRENVFESNSSSCHSLTLCSKKEYDDWSEGKSLFSHSNNELVYKSELYKKCLDTIQGRIQKLESKPDRSSFEKTSLEKFRGFVKNMLSEEAFNKTVEKLLNDFDGSLNKHVVENFEILSQEKQFVLNVVEIIYGELVSKSAYNEIVENSYYEDFYEIKNINGVDVVAFGYSGYNG